MKFLFSFLLYVIFAYTASAQQSSGVCTLSLSLNGTNPLCYKEPGLIVANVSGAQGDVTYSWPGEGYGDTSSIMGIAPITYICIATDTAGCSDTATIALTQPNILVVTIAVTTNPTCPQSNGAVTATPTGGTPGYTYFWNNGDVNATADSLSSGVLFVQCRDANNCYATATFVLNSTNGPIVTVDSVHAVKCNNDNNGEIFISVNGGVSPYTYYWSNGEHSEDISNLEGVPHDIVVKDVNGCAGGNIIQLTNPAPLIANVSVLSPPNCNTSNGQAAIMPSGGTFPYTTQWSASAGGGTMPFIFGFPAGIYQGWVTDANGCVDTAYVLMSNDTGAVVTLDSLYSAGCKSFPPNGAAFVSISSFSNPVTTNWSNGSTNADLLNVNPGYYLLTVADANGCITYKDADIYGIEPGVVQLCMTTVDSTSHLNVITWEKNVPGIAEYKIYRETCMQDLFTLIAQIPADSMSQYTDTVAVPDEKPFRYQIEALDSCGNITVYSLTHKTIHLHVESNLNPAYNDLSWDDYQGLGYTGFNILRYHFTTGWTVLTSVPAGTNFYTDMTPIAPIDSNYYFVEINNNGVCTPTYRIGPGLVPDATIKKSRSNINNNRAAGLSTGIKVHSEGNLRLYPNPADKALTVEWSGVSAEATVTISDITGRVVIASRIFSGKLLLDVSGLSAGAYSVEINTDRRLVSQKLIIQ
jgi:hypothetical protein